MAKKKEIVVANNSVSVATKLHDVASEIKRLEAIEAELRDELLASMKAQGVKFVKLDGGETYSRAERKTLTIVKGFEDKAIAWAQQHNALKVDTTKAKEILRHSFDPVPLGFKETTTEYLIAKHMGDKE